MDDNHDGEDEFILNEYAVDDTLDPLSRLVKYHTSDFSLQRMVLIRELTDTAKYAGFDETNKVIIPLLNVFVADTEPGVRQAFVQQLCSLAEFLVESGGEEGYQLLITVFLPFAFELLVDKNVEVGTSSLMTLNKLAELVPSSLVESQLLHVVVTLAHDDRAEDYRCVAAQLFNDLAPKFGEHLCTSVVLGEVKMLAMDMSFTVRKTVASNLNNIAKVVGTTTAIEKVLPVFTDLCKDDIWGVRKACAESVVGISEALTDEARLKILCPAFKYLTEDPSRWVRVSSYQILGQFIHTMRKEDISTSLLKTFTDMAFQSEGGDSDFSEFCAFSFPAVVQVVGRERWKELDVAFATLLKDVQWKVRKSLAYSLHDIAQVLGQEISEKCLLTAFDGFLKDLDEVKLGVIINVDKFFAVLKPATREKYTPQLCNVPVESENWRLRNVVASKLGDLAKLVPISSKSPITEIVMKLLDDSVTEVRTSTFHSCAQLLLHLHGTAEYDVFVEQVIALAVRNTFQGRQMFAYIYQQLVELDGNRATACTELLERFIALGKDRVSNVRYVVARVLANSCNNNPEVRHNPKIVLLTKTLSEDQEKDVALLAAAKLPRLENPAMAAAYRV
eukprot:Tbor_TRINITY_DN4748_c0_g3::TRINITY_DN4748_c0_g3_i1::g.17084::m.17084/K15424/PPP4R1; serine/threonine-protein phosphatase 4 regulatory subunit 1